jgi:hypothetical protein
MGSVRAYLIEVLLTSSIGFSSFNTKVSADLHKGFLRGHIEERA